MILCTLALFADLRTSHSTTAIGNLVDATRVGVSRKWIPLLFHFIDEVLLKGEHPQAKDQLVLQLERYAPVKQIKDPERRQEVDLLLYWLFSYGLTPFTP